MDIQRKDETACSKNREVCWDSQQLCDALRSHTSCTDRKLARICGSLAEQLWKRHHSMTHNSQMVVVASGLVLGEGTGAIVVAFVRMFQATV